MPKRNEPYWIACPQPKCHGAHEVDGNGIETTPCTYCLDLEELRVKYAKARRIHG